MKYRYKLPSIAMLLIVVSLLQSVPVSASESENVKISGTARASTITVNVPLSVSFSINPNESSMVTTAPFSFVNSGSAAIDIGLTDITKAAGTQMQVVPYDSLEWDKIGSVKTMKYIALGIVPEKHSAIWSPMEGVMRSKPPEYFKILPAESKPCSLSVKCGRSWTQSSEFSFNMKLTIRLSDAPIKDQLINFYSSKGKQITDVYFTFDESDIAKGRYTGEPKFDNLEVIPDIEPRGSVIAGIYQTYSEKSVYSIGFQGKTKEFQLLPHINGRKFSVYLSHDNTRGSIVPDAILYPFVESAIFADASFDPQQYRIREEQIFHVIVRGDMQYQTRLYVHIAVVQRRK